MMFFRVKLLILFVVAFSLAGLGGSTQKGISLANVGLAHANAQICPTRGVSGACSEYWYPAGPAMGTELATIFTSGDNEYNSLQSFSPSIDFTDYPASPVDVSYLQQDSSLLVSSPVPASIAEVEFMLDNSFWGVPFNFGTNPKGVQIR